MIENLKQKFRKFMTGRYGVDELSKFFMVILLILIVLSIFIRNPGLDSLILGCLLYTSWFEPKLRSGLFLHLIGEEKSR